MDTDAVNAERDAIARLIATNLESCLTDDVETVLRKKQERLNVHVRQAEDKFRKLMGLVYKGKNKWRTDAWSIIAAHLKDERRFVLESADTTAVCTYALYVEAAFLYLRHGSDRKTVVGLHIIVRDDAQHVHRFLSSENAKDIPELEQKCITVAMMVAVLYVDILLRKYPGT